jgi:predicted DsbA family dithiol-disulfide isomerase
MRIDVFHDTTCPWCRIGKAHLQQALARWDGELIEVHYHTFFLNPSIPGEGYPFREYMQAKSDGQVPLEAWFSTPRQMGERAGLIFNFERIEKAPNTTLSHQLIAMIPDEAIIDAVYAAYFEHGRDIGNIAVLTAIAADQGHDAEAIRTRLEVDDMRDEVLADAAWGTRLGVTGVPFFIINQRLAFSGAQPPETILGVLRQIHTEELS